MSFPLGSTGRWTGYHRYGPGHIRAILCQFHLFELELPVGRQ